MGIQEIKAEVETLPMEERRKLAAFLVSLRHKEIEGYPARMARDIDDANRGKWLTLEEMDQRFENPDLDPMSDMSPRGTE